MMTAAPTESLSTEGVRRLEVRWIFPGELAGAVAGWFARFPAETTVLEDAYLLDSVPALAFGEGAPGPSAGGEGVPRQPRAFGGGGACPWPPGVLAEVVISAGAGRWAVVARLAGRR